MLPNEEFALACRAYYEEQGLIVDATNGQFAHCPLPRSMGETGYYLLWEHHQQQGLLQSRDVGKRCFFVGHAHKWLKECECWPDNYFDLWEIFEEFSKPTHDISYLQSAEVKQRRREGQKKSGYSGQLQTEKAQKRAAEGRRSFWRSDRSLELRERIRNRRSSKARRVEIEFVNGKIGTYSTVKIAAIALGVNPGTICRWLQGVRCPGGAFEGLKVREL